MTTRTKATVALGVLALLQVLHLIDELRVDLSDDLGEALLRPQPVLGIGGTLVAMEAVRRGWAAGRALGFTAAGLVALGFVLSHGIPTDTARTKPYWGDGSADVLQWLGVAAILACCATVLVLVRRLPSSRALPAVESPPDRAVTG